MSTSVTPLASDASSPLPGVGDRLSMRYRFERQLRATPLGAIYVARDLVTSEPLTIHVIAVDPSAGDALRRRLDHQLRALRAMTHPGTAQVHRAGRVGDRLAYVVMETLQGEYLLDLIARRERLGRLEASLIARQIVGSLAQAHEQQLIHGGLTSAHVVVRSGRSGAPEVKVLGYGTAWLEHPRGDRVEATAADDLYHTGLVLAEMLTGEAQVPGSGALNGEGGVLEPILRRATHADPDQRYRSAGELSEALDAAVQTLREPEEVGADAPAPTSARPVPEAKSAQPVPRYANPASVPRYVPPASVPRYAPPEPAAAAPKPKPKSPEPPEPAAAAPRPEPPELPEPANATPKPKPPEPANATPRPMPPEPVASPRRQRRSVGSAATPAPRAAGPAKAAKSGGESSRKSERPAQTRSSQRPPPHRQTSPASRPEPPRLPPEPELPDRTAPKSTSPSPTAEQAPPASASAPSARPARPAPPPRLELPPLSPSPRPSPPASATAPPEPPRAVAGVQPEPPVEARTSPRTRLPTLPRTRPTPISSPSEPPIDVLRTQQALGRLPMTREDLLASVEPVEEPPAAPEPARGAVEAGEDTPVVFVPLKPGGAEVDFTGPVFLAQRIPGGVLTAEQLAVTGSSLALRAVGGRTRLRRVVRWGGLAVSLVLLGLSVGWLVSRPGDASRLSLAGAVADVAPRPPVASDPTARVEVARVEVAPADVDSAEQATPTWDSAMDVATPATPPAGGADPGASLLATAAQLTRLAPGDDEIAALTEPLDEGTRALLARTLRSEGANDYRRALERARGATSRAEREGWRAELDELTAQAEAGLLRVAPRLLDCRELVAQGVEGAGGVEVAVEATCDDAAITPLEWRPDVYQQLVAVGAALHEASQVLDGADSMRAELLTRSWLAYVMAERLRRSAMAQGGAGPEADAGMARAQDWLHYDTARLFADAGYCRLAQHEIDALGAVPVAHVRGQSQVVACAAAWTPEPRERVSAEVRPLLERGDALAALADRVERRAYRARVRLDSDPPRARVYLDQPGEQLRLIGRTPLDETFELPQPTLQLLFSKRQHRSRVVDIDLSAGDVRDVVVLRARRSRRAEGSVPQSRVGVVD